jgi:glyoxylase-like metal-dependent hydrolase (beta-lactamase superfamily II)
VSRTLAVACVVGAVLCGVAALAGLAAHRYLSVVEVPVDEHLSVFLGGGGNSIVLTSEDGSEALVVDTKMLSAARYLRSTAGTGRITVVNTHNHPDHIGGNRLYGAARFIGGSGSDHAVPVGQEFAIGVGSETAHIVNLGRAHSAEDLVVYLEKRRLLAAGDLVFVDFHPPYPDPACDISSWIAVLDKILARYDVQVLIPGHGDVSDAGGITAMREYFVSIAAAVDDPAELRVLRNRYQGHRAIALMSGFGKTVSAIRRQRAAGGGGERQ